MNKHFSRGPPRAALSAITLAAMSVWATAANAQLSAAPPASAASAAAASDQLQEIVVTATRRQQRLQDTPIAITVLDAKSLAASGAVDLVDVARIAPNVDLSAGGGGSGGSFNTQAYIRGIGQSDFLLTTDPGVGV